MSEASVRKLTHQDPTEALAAQFGNAVVQVKAAVEALEFLLDRLEKATEQLKEKGVAVEADLGEVGNAARNARRQVAKVPRTTFSFPA